MVSLQVGPAAAAAGFSGACDRLVFARIDIARDVAAQLRMPIFLRASYGLKISLQYNPPGSSAQQAGRVGSLLQWQS